MGQTQNSCGFRQVYSLHLIKHTSASVSVNKLSHFLNGRSFITDSLQLSINFLTYLNVLLGANLILMYGHCQQTTVVVTARAIGAPAVKCLHQ